VTSSAILIPARYGSTRYPGKPLTMLGDKTMIQRVVETCKSSGYDTYVLTDNKTIAMAAEAAGAGVYIDSHDYENGTERCAGAIRSRKFDDYDQFINVQGDMPDVAVEMIEKAIMGLKYYTTSTVFTNMPKEKQDDPNSVKMVRAGDQALWFGRGMTGYGEWHLGVYGYRKNALECYLDMRIEQEERVEKLEQLRWLKNGWQMGCYRVYFNGVEINTVEDVEEWNAKQTH
jgi:3-deoxy-manno-octulosonate cytidylyltransferase (CMP-KDO synthetase)